MSIHTNVISVSHYVPERIVTNDELSALITTSDEWIRERTGIQERRFVAPGVSATKLAEQAASNALAAAQIEPGQVDLLIAATLSPELHFPGIGCQLQSRLGLGPIPALDIRAQCSGLVYGLATADAFIRSGQAKTVLLVCAEVQSTYLNLTDAGRDTAVIFGDGAGALVLGASESASRVVDSLLGSDGSGAELLCMRMPQPAEFQPQHADPKGWHPYMDGKQVFKHAVSRMYDAAEQILARNGLTPADVDLLVPHQANLRINEMVRDRLGIPAERAFNNIERYGNTTAATIPIALSEAVASGRLKQGDLVLTLAFGAGFTWGANLIRW